MEPVPTRASRMAHDGRKSLLLFEAIRLSEKIGYKNITGPVVAEAAGLSSHGLVNYYFGGIEALRSLVLEAAIEHENLEILLQALVVKDPVAWSAPVPLRQAAYEKLRAE